MVCRSVRNWVLVWAALAGTVPRLCAADVRPEAPATYSITRYTTERGLPQNTVRALLQTKDGYLWIGTLAGLARFDGYRFKVFTTGNTPEMTHDAINDLAEDRQDGSLWIRAGRELLRYHRHRFERFVEADGYPLSFGDLWPARQGGVWYSPGYGKLALLRQGTVRAWQLAPEAVLGRRIMQVEEDPDGSLLVLMYYNLFRFDPISGTFTRLGPPYATDTSYRSFHRQADGTLLVASREGIWRGAGTEWRLIEPASLAEHTCPAWIGSTAGGDLWVVWSNEGPPRLARFEGGRSALVDLSGLPDYPVNRFLQDHEGHLWLGTESGLCQLRSRAVTVYAREQGLRDDSVRTVTEGPDGTIWLGTAKGVSGLKDGQVTNLPAIEPPANWGRTEVLLADRRGRVWSGAQANSVGAFEQGAWNNPPPQTVSESWIRVLYEDRFGRIWIGSDQGAGRIDETNGTLRATRLLSLPDVLTIHEDRRGDFWFGTYSGGLNRLHEGKLTTYATALGEFNNRAWCIHEDAEGVFWVGSRAGLNRFVPPGVDQPCGIDSGQSSATNAAPEASVRGNVNRFFTFTTRHGLHEDPVNNLQEDAAGNLWLSGMQGLYRVSRRELNEVAAGRLARAQVLAFGEAEGLLNSQCGSGTCQPAGWKDRAGRLWFPTARGVAMVDPSGIRTNAVPPPAVIEQVLADNQVIFGDGASVESNPQAPPHGAHGEETARASGDAPGLPQQVLAAGRGHVLEIRYTGNSFAAPHRMKFKYRLEGYDPDWRYDEQNRRAAFYTHLPPGAYTFRVAACNNHDVWSQAPAVFAFRLTPHCWQTWPFRVCVGGAVLLLGAVLQAYRLRWQRRLLKLEQQQALAAERTRIAHDLHDDLGTALTGLALQMDVLRRDAGDNPAQAGRLAESAGGIRALAERMREVVWAINPRCDTVSSLASFLEQQAEQFFRADRLRWRLDFPEDIPALPLEGAARHQLALGVREAIANAVRHADASEIVLGLRVEAGRVAVRIADNGRGFDVARCRAYGRGLANMHARIEKLGGQCDCCSTPGAGTVIELRVPLQRPSTRDPNPS